MPQSIFWKTLAIAEASIIATAAAAWLSFGLDSVKHSEIDQIMQTRAPYLHDRSYLLNRLDALDRAVERLGGHPAHIEK